MSLNSLLELPGSPTEQASIGTSTYYWQPANDLAAGETVGVPSAVVYQYQNGSPVVTNVTSTVLAPGSPFLGTGTYAGMIGVTILAGVLQPGFEYRVELSFAASGGHTPVRYFRLKCLI